MSDCGYSYGAGRPLRVEDRRRPVNKGARRGITQAPVRPRRKRRR